MKHPLSFMTVPSILFEPLVQFVLATFVQIIVGYPFYLRAFQAVRNQHANMDVLIVLGTSAAYLYSVYLLFESRLAVP